MRKEDMVASTDGTGFLVSVQYEYKFLLLVQVERMGQVRRTCMHKNMYALLHACIHAGSAARMHASGRAATAVKGSNRQTMIRPGALNAMQWMHRIGAVTHNGGGGGGVGGGRRRQGGG